MQKPLNYDEYMKSTKWRNIANAMKKHANYICAHCKKRTTTVEVHLITYERFGNESMSDLEILCTPCHETAHRKLEEKREAVGRERAYDKARDTYMTKKYGEQYYLTDNPSRDEEFDEWKDNKDYDEFGD
jgi:5-methylcytosine-specific restriction endonuclease McrA